MINILLILVAVILGAIRAFGHASIPFQAIAHFYVGGLIGAWAIGRDKLYGLLAIGLTITEVICFVIFNF